VRVKNIPRMVVKVFEVNTDNYFRKNMEAFTTDINLDGLVALIEKESDFTSIPANQRHTRDFTFSMFKDRRGLFIVEFVGNGISSRAVIYKGDLQLVYRSTIAG
jgi:hypothetical protein